MERETGFEPATSTLARLHSTTELLPLSVPSTGSVNLAIPGWSVNYIEISGPAPSSSRARAASQAT